MAVVQSVLLFGSETWVMTPRLDKYLEGFHHRAARQIAGMGPKCQRDGTWVYPLIGAALAMVGLEEIRVYIARLQNMVAKYIATCPIMGLCVAVEQKPVIRLSRKWWDQPAMDILGIRVRHAEAEGGGGRRGQENQRERDSRLGEDEGEGMI